MFTNLISNLMLSLRSPRKAAPEIPHSRSGLKYSGNKVICQFQGIKDRSHLETLIPFEIFLDREAFPAPPENEVYLVDLIDMMVVNEAGEELGKLESFSDNGMQYLFDVRLNSGEVVTLPYVDLFFPKIDMKNKKITMILPEYTE